MQQTPAPTAPAHDARIELTIRGLLLGALITVVFTAANVYLGLKVGLTFASSIPAAVISMAVLRAFRNATIYENNIVQTVASAAGTLSSVIFVLPGLVMVGWWTGFPFWLSFGICFTGGVLGVMYTIPLRRALVTNSDLPYPEGVAAAEVLKVGVGTEEGAAETKVGLAAVVWGSVVSAVFYLITQTQALAGEVDAYFRSGKTASGLGFGLSFALLGAGHLVGLTVGIAMLVGLIIAWVFAVPIETMIHYTADGDAQTFALSVWKHYVRFIGAGAIGISAIWTLIKLIRPVGAGLMAAMAANRKRAAGLGSTLPRVEQDIPINWVGLISLFVLIPIVGLLAAFLAGTPLAGSTISLTLGATLYIVIIGFVVAAVAGYMAGLIGSSNSPVSGLAILAALGATLVLVAVTHGLSDAAKPALVAYALFVTALVINVATISNDNLQDLKTGQLVNATPWKQQVALIVGTLCGALVIPPILDGLNHAYGFAGAPNLAAGQTGLPAPQAALISALAKGVIGGALPWDLIGWGALLGLIVILIDEVMQRTSGHKLPPLAVALGIYLPAGTIVMVVIGAVAGYFYNRAVVKKKNGEAAKRMGVLLASGLIVGESLMGVVMSGIIVAAQRGWIPVKDPDNPLTLTFLPANFGTWAETLGAIVFIVAGVMVYRWASTLVRRLPENTKATF